MGYLFYKFLAILLLLSSSVLMLGCRREHGSESIGGFFVATNAAASAVLAEETPSEDMKSAIRMSHLLDEDDRIGALALARSLMDSPEQKVRLIAIETMGWIGKVSLPELVEMMDHEDEVTAEAALASWEHAFGEIVNDARRIEEVMKAAKSLKRSKMIEMVLFRLDECDERASLLALDACILSTKGKGCNPLAKAAYERLAGEAWISSARTTELVSKTIVKGDNNE